jgi:hypothetical protein
VVDHLVRGVLVVKGLRQEVVPPALAKVLQGLQVVQMPVARVVVLKEGRLDQGVVTNRWTRRKPTRPRLQRLYQHNPPWMPVALAVLGHRVLMVK